MVILQKADAKSATFGDNVQDDLPEIASMQISGRGLDDLLTKEWLLTNQRGGYASSTVVGCNTRRYHGLLIGSLRPPAERILALSNCVEMVLFEDQTPSSKGLHTKGHGKIINLSTFEFSNSFAPQGFKYLKNFRQDVGVHFDYQLDGLSITKSVYLLHQADKIALVYDFSSIEKKTQFILRPLVALRDFHSLQKSYAHLCSKQLDTGLLVHHDAPNSCQLLLACPSANFETDQQWWFNFVYRNDRQRGQDFKEDLWSPGFFKYQVQPDVPTKIVLWASLKPPIRAHELEKLIQTDINSVREELFKQQQSIIEIARQQKTKNQKKRTKYSAQDTQYDVLCLAADNFIATRAHQSPLQPPANNSRFTILAGFPWFLDWGRDAFIALPGLLLSTGKFDQARSVLTNFAKAADEGMIPNRFDDYSNTAHFNSVDASLWFINASFQFLNTTEDSKTFKQQLLPTIRWIIDSYQNGTRFNIHSDSDGLITAGDEQTQLTWMDAKYDDAAFTPRFGKAVEANALWYNALKHLDQFYSSLTEKQRRREEKDAQYAIQWTCYGPMADKVKKAFRKLFWNKERRYLNDCILPDGSVDASLRPNQIFAVSLDFSPLTANQQKAVIDVVQKNLLAPYGLRTLDPRDKRYKGIYIGTQKERDQAYHQGTVWPFLMGAFVQAYLKVNKSSQQSRKQAAKLIEPLMKHLTEDGCLGQISEIFDGDEPHQPRGCFAQAWSVAELIRSYQLIHSPAPASPDARRGGG